jgi:gamma-aminobutyric acid receptor subunit alpha
VSRQVTRTLDGLFHSGYSKQFRPGLGQAATQVEVNLAIRSMGPVDERRQEFTFDCYFRQYWTDTRLSFNSTVIQELPMNWQVADVLFLNYNRSLVHLQDLDPGHLLPQRKELLPSQDHGAKQVKLPCASFS